MIRCQAGLFRKNFYFLPTVKFYRDDWSWFIGFYVWNLYFKIDKTTKLWEVVWE